MEKDVETADISLGKGNSQEITLAFLSTHADLVNTIAESHSQTRMDGQPTETSNYEDPSSTIWSVYVSEAEMYDKSFVEDWAADMDGILIFVSYFSSVDLSQ
jgi:hypothetical protein